MTTKSKRILGIVIALLVCVGLCVYPLMAHPDSEFGGADGAADEIITSIETDYEPWAEPMWAPPGGETESLLFCLQAALGSGVFCFGIGYLAASRKYQKKEQRIDDNR